MSKNTYILITSILILAIAAGTWYAVLALQKKPTYQFIGVERRNIVQGLQTTGTVEATQDISLSFQVQGTISQIPVSAGSLVKTGETLISLDNKNAVSSINQAKAALEATQADYQKLLNGATSQQIAVTQAQVTSAQTAYDSAQKNLENVEQQQAVLVSNAYSNLLNSSVAAVAGVGNSDSVIPTVSGTYVGDQQGAYNISIYNSGSGLRFQYTGLESGDGPVNTSPQSLGQHGLFIKFPSIIVALNDSWTISIPNTQAATYVTNYNAYQAALKTQQTSLTAAQSQLDAAKTALEQTQAALTLQTTPARPEDIAAAKAAVDVAQAQLQTANNLYSNGILVSPIDGVITNVDAKIGETAIPGKTVISMISNEMYKVEVFLNEKDLGRIKKDDAAEITLDAYGPKVKFDASVTDINPAATIQNGLQSYKVTLRFKQGTDELVRQGMGANVTIKDQQKNNVIAVPEQDVFGTDSTDFVLIDNGRGLIEKQAVAAGLEGLDGFLEITSGLSQNQKIVSFSQ